MSGSGHFHQTETQSVFGRHTDGISKYTGENQNSGDNKAKQRTLINNTSVRISVLHLSLKYSYMFCMEKKTV